MSKKQDTSAIHKEQDPDSCDPKDGFPSPCMKRKRKGLSFFRKGPRPILKNQQKMQEYSTDSESSDQHGLDLHGLNNRDAANGRAVVVSSRDQHRVDVCNATHTHREHLTPTKQKMFSCQKKTGMADTHNLSVELLSGQDLAPRDSNGLSDPYVKLKVDGVTAFKSKCCRCTLNPRWDERCEVRLNRSARVTLHVYDHDRGMRDDFMGRGDLALDRLDPTARDITIHLEEPGSSEELGFVHLRARLFPLCEDSNSEPATTPEEKQVAPSQMVDSGAGEPAITNQPTKQRSSPERKRTTSLRRGIFSDGSQSMAVAVATVQLVSGTDLPSRDTNGFSDPYVKLSLGNSFKRKSKTCWKTLNPVWKEEFVFPLADKSNSTLVMHVWDKDSYRRDDYIGGVEVDLWSLQRDTTHHMSVQLVDTTGKLDLLVTVQDTEPDKNQLTTYDLQQLRSRYGYLSTLSSVKDVGFAEVRVKSASGLRSADFIGKSDPFCVVKLCNSRAQTQTCRNTLDPEWDRVFTFAIKDIHDVFEVSVYDSDHVGGREFLGRVSIPILRVRNGEDQVLALKDQKFGDKCKGRVKLQISYIYNPVRAAIRTFSPREEKLMQEAAKFRKSELMNNFQRVWRLVQATLTALEFVDSCFKWERPARSFVAFLAFILIVWNFEVYMLPIWLLVVLVKNYVDIFLRGVAKTADDAAFELATKLSQDDDDDDENKSFFQRINALQEVLTKVQVVLDELASFGERLNNTVSWGVPFLGWLAIFVLTLLAGVLYYVPLRVLILLWGVNKFTKALRNRGKVKDNNELMDFISRVPSNLELDRYREFPVDPVRLRRSDSKKKKS